MLRCKEGDLAIVLSGPYVGYLVTVVAFVGDKKIRDVSNGWGLQTNLWVIRNKEIESENPGCRMHAGDSYLQPIRPGGTGVTTETKKEIAA